MGKADAIKIWEDGAKDAMLTCDKLFESKRYHHALFFLHLALEKILKALYVSRKDMSPPFSHSLVDLAERVDLNLNKEKNIDLAQISEFNVSARYENYKYKIYKMATKEFAEKWMNIGKIFYESILKLI